MILNLLRVGVWPGRWLVLVTLSCTRREGVYARLAGFGVFSVPARLGWLVVHDSFVSCSLDCGDSGVRIRQRSVGVSGSFTWSEGAAGPVLSGSGLPPVSGPPSVENVSASGHTLAWRPLSLKLTYSHCSLLTLRFCVVQISSFILSDCAFVYEDWPFQTAYRGDAFSLPQSVWCVFRVTVER